MSKKRPTFAISNLRAVRGHVGSTRRLFAASALLALVASACGDAGGGTDEANTPVNGGLTGMPAATGSSNPAAVGPAAGTPSGTAGASSATGTPAPGAPAATPQAPGTPAASPGTPADTTQPVDTTAMPVDVSPDPTPGVPTQPETPSDTPVVDTPTPDTPSPDMPSPELPAGNCAFDVNYELSSAIGTVGIVTWSTDITVDSATIEFGMAGQDATLSAPVDLTEPEYRTLLLGMKGSSDYEFHIVANGGGQTCTSETFSLTTDPVPNSAPRINVNKNNEGAASKGFFVTSAGLGNFGGGGGGGGGSTMFIFDTDGDIVWWAESPSNASRARMDWEGKNMYVMALNYPESGGQIRRVSMDGLDVDGNVMGLGTAHHDFTVAPNGVVTAVLWSGGCNSIVERSPDGSLKTIVESVESLYQPAGGLGGGGFECHGNAITYQPETDTYVLSDRNPNLFVKFDRQGKLLWQFGGNNPVAGAKHIQGSWNVNHGHHLLPDGTFLFFNNEGGNPSPIKEYSLNESAGTANLVWEYSGNGGSATLGDVQRLANGNTVITYSNGGTVIEVDPGKNVLQEFSTDSLGYVVFRESLYGPPPK